MKRLALAGVAVLAAVLLALAWVPGAVEPHVWQPPPVVPETAATRVNQGLETAERFAPNLIGPEAVVFDAQGRLVTGARDGRIVRFATVGDTFEVLGDTKGRPLGLAYDAAGRLIICDAHHGLLMLDGAGQLTTLATEEGGVPFGLADDLEIDSQGVIYFTDASTRRSVEQFTEDLLEHQLTGRVLAYDPATKKVRRLAEGFNFVNGLTIGPDEQYLVFSETGAYRLWRHWLKGEKAGQTELFTDSLPGFPDNVRYSKTRRVFWVALGSPRNRMIDALAAWPHLRLLVARLPKWLQPAPVRHAWAQAVGEDGVPVLSLHDTRPTSYSPVASVIEHEGWLYLGSFAREGLARVKAP